MGKRHARRGVALVVLLGLALAACSSSSSTGGSGNNNGQDTSKPTPGGAVTIAMEAETTGGWCLPQAQLAAAGIQVARAIYDTLTVPDENNNYVPFLADTITPNADHTVWKIHVRPGIKFHDGTDLTAKVVKDNLDAYTGKTDHKNLLFLFEFDAAHWINDIKVTDPMTVEVDMKHPWVAFPSHLYAYGRLGIEAEAQLNSGANCFKKMIGTGPFKFDGDWTVNDHLTVNKNPNYWRKDADGVQLPYLEKVTFKPVTETSRLVNGMQTKQFDLALTDSADALNDLGPLQKAGTLNWIQDNNFPEVTYAIFNSTKAPFNNINARKAYSFAVNSDEYNQLRQHGLQTKTCGPFGTSVMGYVPCDQMPAGTIPPSQGDIDQAKTFAAAYKTDTNKDLAFTYLTGSDPLALQSAQLIKSYMDKAGIKMDIKQEEQSQNINDVIAKNYQVSGWRNHPGFDPDDQWIWWHCYSTPAAATPDATNIATPGPPKNGNNCDNPVNFGGFNDSIINTSLETGRSNPDPAARKSAYEALNKEFATQFWNAWGFYSIWTIPYQTNIHNVLGVNLPTATSPDVGGPKPFPGLSSWVDISGLWRSN